MGKRIYERVIKSKWKISDSRGPVWTKTDFYWAFRMFLDVFALVEQHLLDKLFCAQWAFETISSLIKLGINILN